MTGRFTGWHMTAILVGFFGIVITVNLVMATAAVSGFGGTVVDNSYVASQNYNRWLAQSAAQKRLGWTMTAALDGERHLLLTPGRGDMSSPTAEGAARQPLGSAPERRLDFVPVGGGRLRSVQTLPTGRWQVRIAIEQRGETIRLLENLS